MYIKAWRILLLLCTTLLILPTGQLQTVKADSRQRAQPQSQMQSSTPANTGQWSFWSVEVDFLTDTPHFEWELFYGDYDSNGDMRLLTHKTMAIPCRTYGELEIHEERAYFDGLDDRIECDIPDYAGEVFDLSKGQLILPQSCLCKDPLVVAKLTLDPVFDGAHATSNPLFVLEEPAGGRSVQYPIRFDTPIVGNEMAESVMQLALPSATFTTTMPWRIAQPGNLVFAGQNPQKFLWRYRTIPSTTPMIEAIINDETFIAAAARMASSDFLHWARTWDPGETELSVTNVPSFPLTTGSTILHIGYDGQNYFKGNMAQSSFDPGCRTH